MRSLPCPRLPLLVLLVTALAAGCDDPPPKAEPSQAGASAAITAKGLEEAPKDPVVEQAAAEAKPEEKPVEKKPVVCTKGKVEFSDPALEKEVRRKAAKLEGEMTVADLRKVRSVDLTRGGAEVESLDPCILPQLTSLHHLYIGKGTITDLTPIKGLTKLEGLRISMNPVSDITPLAAMLAMDRLDLGRTMVRDLTPLKKMTKLTELQLDDTPVEDLTPLAGLTSLERLSIKRTRVSDVSPLKGLRKLKFLYVGGSPIESSGGLARPGLKISAED
jgi:internalin A